MAITDYKIADANKVTLDDTSGETPTLKLISSLSDRPADDGYSSADLKAIWDAIPITYLGLLKMNGFIVEYNSLIDFLDDLLTAIKGDGWTDENIKANADSILVHKTSGDHDGRYFTETELGTTTSGSEGATKIGATVPTGVTASANVQAIITALAALVKAISDAKGVANGYASLDSNGQVPLTQMNDSVKERVVVVSSIEERNALTINDVQNGDAVVVSVVDGETVTETWYRVIDDTKLDETAGYRAISSGTASAAVVANEYNPTYSGGNSIKDKFDTKQNALSYDSIPTAESDNVIKSKDLKTAFDAKQNTLTIDTTPTESSTNPISSGAVHTALNGKTSIFTVADATITTIWKGYGEIATSNDLNGLDIRLNLTTPSAKTSGSVVTILAFTDNATDYITYQCDGTDFIITGYGIFAGISQTLSDTSTAITEVKVSVGSGNYTVATYDTTPDATNGGTFKVEKSTTSGTLAPFTQDIEVSGLTTDFEVHIKPNYSAVDSTKKLENVAWNKVTDILVETGKLKCLCLYDKPTQELNVKLVVI